MHAECGSVMPRIQFGPSTGSEVRCAKKPGHAWDHRDATEQHSWPQTVMISAEEMDAMAARVRADPGNFKSLGCLVTHCRCKELDP
jgi:hypothetical protein